MSDRVINWFRYASPQTFYPLAGKLIPWFWALAAIFGVAGLTIGFLLAPTDAQQGEGYRIIFLHVPASWMSMFIYLVMAFWAGHRAGFQYPPVGHDGLGAGTDRRALRFPLAVDRRPVGQTDVGHLVGVGRAPDIGIDPALPLHRLHRPAGGDRRSAPGRQGRRDPGAGRVVNIPIIYFSVKWWNTLHQGASVSLTKAPSMAR
jgi:heme exporter protein C